MRWFLALIHKLFIDMSDEFEGNDDSLWKVMTKDVKPMQKNDARQVTPDRELNSKIKSSKDRKIENRLNQIDHKPKASHKIQQLEDPKGFEVDGRTSTKLARGQIEIEATIDLHGMRQQQAFDVLRAFIMDSWRLNRRCVLVITGKGKVDLGNNLDPDKPKPGVIKRMLPNWLKEPDLNRVVLKTQTAHLRHGGDGAVYIYLRRNRNI